jgi:multisubunit Na+/H+ antiporter MnhG subunit
MLSRSSIRADFFPEGYVRLNDLIDPERGPAALVKLATYPLIFLVVCSSILMLVAQLPAKAVLGALFLLLLASPVAYLIREARGHRAHPGGARRGGAERTPLLPPNEDLE